MQFGDYLAVLRKRWLMILLVTVLGLAGAAALSVTATPTFQASASVYFSLPDGKSASDLNQGATYTQSQVLSYAALATAPVILQPVIDALQLDQTPASLAARVTAAPVANTVILVITVSDTSPARAAAVANAVADQLGLTAKSLAPKDTSGKPTIDYAVIAKATPPRTPSTPKTTRNLAAGLLAGLFAGIALAIVRELLDTTFRSSQDLRALTDLPVVGVIGFDRSARRSPLIIDGGGKSTRGEAFRQLRTNLQFVDVERPVRVLVVTSSVAEEGKSTTASNLAMALAEAGRKVLLVEADMRRPRVAEYLGIEGAVGLTNVLAGQVDLEDVMQTWGRSGLTVLPTGTIPPNPSELLGSPAMIKLLHVLRSKFDVIIVDTPPLLPVTDGAVAAANADGVLLVVRYGKTSRNNVLHALRSLAAVDARVLGTVLNMVPTKGADAHGSYGYGYTDTAGPPAEVPAAPIVGGDGTAATSRHTRSSAPATPAVDEPPGAVLAAGVPPAASTADLELLADSSRVSHRASRTRLRVPGGKG